MKPGTLVRLLGVLVILGVAVLAIVFKSEVAESTRGLFEWVDSIGWYGPVVVAAAYIVSCVLLVPGSLLTLAAGFLFGLGLGFVTVSIGSVAGAAAAFLVGRYLARGAMEAKVGENPKFQAIARVAEEKGFRIVFLTRLAPAFPFNLLNYGYGLTRVSFSNYFFASWIGMIPGTIMYVYFGSVLGNLAELFDSEREKSVGETVAFWGGLAATVIVTIIVTRIAKRALDDAVRQGGGDSPPTAEDLSKESHA